MHLGLRGLLGVTICVARIFLWHLVPRSSSGCSTAQLKMARVWGCTIHNLC